VVRTCNKRSGVRDIGDGDRRRGGVLGRTRWRVPVEAAEAPHAAVLAPRARKLIAQHQLFDSCDGGNFGRPWFAPGFVPQGGAPTDHVAPRFDGRARPAPPRGDVRDGPYIGPTSPRSRRPWAPELSSTVLPPTPEGSVFRDSASVRSAIRHEADLLGSRDRHGDSVALPAAHGAVDERSASSLESAVEVTHRRLWLIPRRAPGGAGRSGQRPRRDLSATPAPQVTRFDGALAPGAQRNDQRLKVFRRRRSSARDRATKTEESGRAATAGVGLPPHPTRAGRTARQTPRKPRMWRIIQCADRPSRSPCSRWCIRPTCVQCDWHIHQEVVQSDPTLHRTIPAGGFRTSSSEFDHLVREVATGVRRHDGAILRQRALGDHALNDFDASLQARPLADQRGGYKPGAPWKVPIHCKSGLRSVTEPRH